MIPVTEMTTWFDLMEDKVASAYFTASERETFINQAIVDYILSYFPPNWKNGMDITQQLAMITAPLKSEVTVSTDSTGGLAYTAIETALGNSYKYWMVLNAARAPQQTCGTPTSTSYKKVKFVRDNDYYQFTQNEFKKPTDDYPFLRLLDKIQFDPQELATVKMTILRYPVKVVSTGTTVDSDMPYFTKSGIMKIALINAGFSMRDVDWVMAQTQVSNANAN